MCFVLSWNIGFAAICVAALLSQNNAVGYFSLNPISCSNLSNPDDLQVVKAIALYTESAEDLQAVACFFVFQEIRDSPSLLQ